MAHNLPETRGAAQGRGADYEPYFLRERGLTSLLPTTQQPNRLPGHS
jgi:hypothetical protein